MATLRERHPCRTPQPGTGNYNHPMRRLLALAVLALAAFSAHASLPFIENDYAKAVARAKAKNLPIFVEAWAPW